MAKKTAPAGSRTAKKKFLKNISKGDMKKGSAKGMKKTKSLKVISGHDGHLLHPKGMADAPP